MVLVMRPLAGVRRLLARMRGRPDSEHEMSFNRVIMGLGILGYAYAIHARADSILVAWAFLIGGFIAAFLIAADQEIRPTRRMLMMFGDMSSCAYMMHANGAATAAFYPFLLWAILGNGFRFGVKYLYASSLVAVACFAVVVVCTPFWRGLPALAVGLTFGLIAVPLYTATLIRKLSTATRQAEDASRAKSYFLASVSHELRTPLTAIIGLGQHLQESEQDEERRQTTGTIVSAGRSLLSMINRLLDYSRFEAEQGRVAADPFELPALLRGVRDLLVFNAQEKGLLLGIDIEPGTPLALIGDMPHLRDVLVNLVGNAVKFTQRGAITIQASMVAHADGRPMLRIAVSDTGIGIATDAQDHIFGSFQQADATIIDRFGGTGLGLAICKQLATLLGGEIGVDSKPGQGSSFWFTALVGIDEGKAAADGGDARAAETAPRIVLFAPDGERAISFAGYAGAVEQVASEQALAGALEASPTAIVIVDARLVHEGVEQLPLGRLLARGVAPVLLSTRPAPRVARTLFVTRIDPFPDADALAEAIAIARALCDRRTQPTANDEPEPSTRRGLRVLLADDNKMNQKVLSMILRRVGHEVTSVPDGEVALDRMKDHSYDLVLMDVNMPVLNGVEATKLYRFAALGQRRVPIVGVTADASPATAQRCIDAGMDACIEKPVEAEELLDLIDRLAGETIAPAPPRPAFDPAGVVTPLFPAADGPAETPAIDWSSLEELDELGGRAFVAELVDVYMKDAAELLEDVRRAVDVGDIAAFRLGTHAFRSSAANIGAARLSELCQHYQRISEPEFQSRGRAHVLTLERELSAVAEALRARESWVRASVG